MSLCNRLIASIDVCGVCGSFASNGRGDDRGLAQRAGAVSRIVPQFEAGQVVTVPRDIADTVVTEYGVACLLNRSVRERATAISAVAHPDFRAELRRAARGLFWP